MQKAPPEPLPKFKSITIDLEVYERLQRYSAYKNYSFSRIIKNLMYCHTDDALIYLSWYSQY
jgi:predicted CopG family antitoxin